MNTIKEEMPQDEMKTGTDIKRGPKPNWIKKQPGFDSAETLIPALVLPSTVDGAADALPSVRGSCYADNEEPGKNF